jgi:uncharacterized protein (DUF58 family)
MDRELFDREFLRKLEYLTLVSRRLYRGEARGAHRSARRGFSPDFADHRAYQPGDDLRSIDWNAFQRLNRLFVKMFVEEEDLSVHILLDTSLSMGCGKPRKIDYARRVAAALGHIAITSLDRLGVSTFSAGISGALAPRRGRSQLFHLLDYLSRTVLSGTTDISGSLERYALRTRQPGLAVVISDLLDPAGLARGLAALLYRRFDVVVIQVLDREEISPAGDGPLRLTDVETGRTLTLTLDRSLRAAYGTRVRSFLSGIEQLCLRSGVEYLRSSTLVPFEDLVLKYLRQGAHLHSR